MSITKLLRCSQTPTLPTVCARPYLARASWKKRARAHARIRAHSHISHVHAHGVCCVGERISGSKIVDDSLASPSWDSTLFKCGTPYPFVSRRPIRNFARSRLYQRPVFTSRQYPILVFQRLLRSTIFSPNHFASLHNLTKSLQKYSRSL